MKILPLTMNSTGREILFRQKLANVILISSSRWDKYNKKIMSISGAVKLPFEQIIFNALRSDKINYITLRLPYLIYKIMLFVCKKCGLFSNISDEIFLHMSQDLTVETAAEIKSVVEIGSYNAT